MKIFYLSGRMLPSQNSFSVHVMKMAQAFAKAGHDVTLFAQSAGASSQDLFEIYDTEPNFKLHLFSRGNLPIVSRVSQFRGLMQKMRHDSRPDLIYGHDPVALSLFHDGCPIIFELQEMPRHASQGWAIKQILRLANLNAIISVSDALKQDILKLYPEIPPEKIFVAHDGADLLPQLKEENDKITLRGRKNALQIGYTGSLTPGKGINMINRIADLRPDYEFHIVGGKKKQIQRIETNGRRTNVHFYGHREHAEIPSYLSAFDICIAPYQHRALIKTGQNTSRWISPMKIFEYMAAKKPIISSRISVIEEILQHEDTALLPPASDEEKWAQCIDRLATNKAFSETLAYNAHQRLKNLYTWDKRVDAILEHYKATSNNSLPRVNTQTLILR